MLIALLGTGKGTWVEVHSLLNLGAFSPAVLFIDEWAVKDYKNEYGATLVSMPADASTEQLITLFKEHIKAASTPAEFDVAINIASGTGKQHAALMTAVLQLGYGIRLVSIEQGQLKVLT